MPYVQRDDATNIVGVYAKLQSGYAEELLPDDDAAVVAFNNPPPAPAPRDPLAELDALKQKLVDKAVLTKADADAVSAAVAVKVG